MVREMESGLSLRLNAEEQAIVPYGGEAFARCCENRRRRGRRCGLILQLALCAGGFHRLSLLLLFLSGV